MKDSPRTWCVPIPGRGEYSNKLAEVLELELTVVDRMHLVFELNNVFDGHKTLSTKTSSALLNPTKQTDSENCIDGMGRSRGRTQS